MRRVELGAAATLLAMLLTGCVQPTDPTPSASPSPTFMCTPEAGGHQAPCSEADYQKMKEKDALYDEAEQVYRKYLKSFLAVAQRGGARQLPKELRELIGNEKLAAAIEKEVQILQESRLRVRGDSVRIGSTVRIPGKTSQGSVVALKFCTDASKNELVRDGKVVGMGKTTNDLTFFAIVSGSMKMVDMESELVKGC